MRLTSSHLSVPRWPGKLITHSTLALASLTFACSDPGPTQTEGSGGAPAIPPVVATGNVVNTETLADGTVVETTDDGYTIATATDGTITVTSPDGTKTVTSPDGTITTTAVDGTVTITLPDGTTTTILPNGGTGGTNGGGGTDGAGGVSGTGATEGSGGAPASATTWLPSNGRISASSNTFGIQGDWYAFGDGVTTEQSGNPYEDGKNCVHGLSTGEEGNWGAGIGLDLNNVGEKLPYVITGKVTGFRMKITGAIPSPARLSFVTDPDVDVNPFIEVTPGTESVIYNVKDAQVPLSWTVDNAGARVEDVVYSVQLLAPGDSEAGAIDLCIEEFEPIYDENAISTGVEGTAFINSDGFVSLDANDYGVQGPVYVISDGNSTTQSGVPYQDGKYCVAGEFLGGADDWGAGIAFDLNNAPGADRAAFDPTGKVAGFRVGLSGSTPGGVRIQYVINEPQTDDQPFLVGQMNTSYMYPIAWAQVPASWEVPDAGLEVTDSIVTMQIFLEGDQPGPFNVCVEELAPLAASEIVYAASAADAGFNGFKTLDEARFADEYAMWKDRHFQDCGDGSACIPRDDGDCISEGIGYGMLITVGYDDQAAFDQLWSYFKKNMRPSGLMNWQTSACGGVIGDGAATDGDIDAAMALIQAGCKWGGSYAADAATLINSISTSAVVSCSGGSTLMPGDDFGGCSETNPSYVAPGYYRIFEQVTGNTVWSDLLDSGYDLVAANQTRKGGEFSDWSNDAGQAATTGNHSDDFGPDASRVPWRIATDYVWNAEPRAAAILDTFRNHVESLDGPQRAFTPNSNYRGGSALSAIHTDAATAQQYTDAWLLTSVDDATYFPGTLRPIYMLLAANKFEKGCSQ